MKYRDLIFVICLVALGALAWSSLSAKPSNDSPAVWEVTESPLALESPTPQNKKLPKTVPESPPSLHLAIEGRPGRVEELVVEVSVHPQDYLTVHLNMEKVPVADLFLTLGEKTWTFKTRDRVPVAEFQVDKLDGYSWKLVVKDMIPPPDIDSLRTVFGSNTLEISAVIQEGEGQTEDDMFRRRVIRMISGTTTLEPLSSSEL